jgi:hypothetical protein
MDEYETISDILEQIEVLLEKHPHLLISRQRVIEYVGQES